MVEACMFFTGKEEKHSAQFRQTDSLLHNEIVAKYKSEIQGTCYKIGLLQSY